MARFSRRRVLASSAVVVAGLSGLAAVRAWGYRVAPEIETRLRVLKGWQYVVIDAVGLRILAPERHSIGLFADQYLEGLQAEDQRDIGRFLAYVEHLAPLSCRHFRRFTALSPAAQDQVLASLETSSLSDLRAGFQAVKGLALMDFYRRPQSWPKIGYDGPVVVR